MTRVQQLAKVMNARVLEDVGYRGIIHNAEHGHMRYHITSGLQQVERTNRTWRTKKTILTTAQIDEFLSEASVKEDRPVPTLELIAQCLDGEIIAHLQSGGGVMRVQDQFVRFSPIQGLDIVEHALTKWVRKDSVFRLPALKTIVSNHRWEQLKEMTYERIRERGGRVSADGGGGPRGGCATQGAA
jgi:hypothetical protein